MDSSTIPQWALNVFGITIILIMGAIVEDLIRPENPWIFCIFTGIAIWVGVSVPWS